MEFLRRFKRTARGVPYKFLLGIVAVTLAAHFCGAFGHANRWFYDIMLIFQPPGKDDSPPVLVIEGSSRALPPQSMAWDSLVDFLSREHAAAIVFEEIPDASREFFESLANREDMTPVIFGQSASIDPDNPDEFTFSRLPAGARDLSASIYLAPNYLPEAAGDSGDGIWRWHRGMISRSRLETLIGVSGKEPLLETLVAKLLFHRLAIRQRSLPTGRYGIRFRAGRDRHHRVAAHRLLENDIPGEFVRDRIVIVESASRTAAQRISTPFHRGTGTLTEPMFRAAAIDSLLRGDFILPVGPKTRLAVFSVSLASCLVLFVWLKNTSSFLLTACLGVVAVSWTWILLHFLHFWLPPAEFLAMAGSLGIIFRITRENNRTLMLKQLFMDTYERVHEKHDAQRFVINADPWPYVERILRQSFLLEEMVFLEPSVEDPRELQLVYSGEHSEDLKGEIANLRLSLNLSPFWEAMGSDTPQHWERASHDFERSSQIFVLPFRRNGSLFGFVVFSVADDEVGQIKKIRKGFSQYREAISSLLAQRMEWRASDSNVEAIRGARTPNYAGLHHRVERSVGLLEHELQLNSDILHRTASARIVFDGFGHLIEVNRAMNEILKDKDLVFTGLSPDGFANGICGLSPKQTRRVIRYVSADRGTVRIPSFKLGDKVMGARVQPIEIPIEGAAGSGNPEGLAGIIFELEDITEFNRLTRQRDTLLERIHYKLKDDISSLLQASMLLKDERTPAEMKNQMVDMISTKLRQTSDSLVDIRSYFRSDDREQDFHPIDPRPPLQSAMDKVEKEAGHKRFEFILEMPELVPMVLANPTELETVFETVLSILAGDAFDESEIGIEIRHSKDKVVFQFTGKGTGLPQDQLDLQLTEGSSRGSKNMRKLAGQMALLQQWNASLQSGGEVGAGLTFALTLKAVV